MLLQIISHWSAWLNSTWLQTVGEEERKTLEDTGEKGPHPATGHVSLWEFMGLRIHLKLRKQNVTKMQLDIQCLGEICQTMERLWCFGSWTFLALASFVFWGSKFEAGHFFHCFFLQCRGLGRRSMSAMSYEHGLPRLDLPQLNLVNALPRLKRQDFKVSDTQRPQNPVQFTAILPGTNEDQDEKHVDFTLEVVVNPSEDCSHCRDCEVSQNRSKYRLADSSTDPVGTSRSEPSIQSAGNDPNERHGEESKMSKDMKESGTNSLSGSIQTIGHASPMGPSATQMALWARASSRKEHVSNTLVSTVVTANDMLEKVFGEPLPDGIGSKSLRLTQLVLGGLCSALIAGLFSTLSLVISGLWAVPGHQDASFVDGLLNRLVWSISPCFLGAFFPAVGYPDFMTDWRSHRFFVLVSLVPFIIADVLFPYVVGTDSNFKVFFSTCFWPTITCIFFLPSMVAGIRRCRGDPDWQELKSQLLYIQTECNEFGKDFGRLIVCFVVVVAPVNYIALDFAVVLPNMHPNTAALLRPAISMCIKFTCFQVFKFASSNLSPWLHIYGLFPLALNTGLHNAMAVLLCQDWRSVQVWIACDYAIIFWRTRRLRSRTFFGLKSFTYLSWLSEDDFIRRRGFENIVMGWGLTASLCSMLMVVPFLQFLPEMMQIFLFPQGTTSVWYLVVVCIADILADIMSLTYLTHACKCDFGHILADPLGKPLRCAYLTSLSVVWAPCAIGCFGWVFQHLCVASFENACWAEIE